MSEDDFSSLEFIEYIDLIRIIQSGDWENEDRYQLFMYNHSDSCYVLKGPVIIRKVERQHNAKTKRLGAFRPCYMVGLSNGRGFSTDCYDNLATNVSWYLRYAS